MTKTIQCAQCGAGIATPSADTASTDGTGELTCGYCGSVTRLRSLPEQAFDHHRYISPKHCPRCHHKTVETDIRGCLIRTCHQCGGLWVPIVALRKFGRIPAGEYENLRQLNKSKVQRKPALAKARHGALKCPACTTSMTQHVYGRGAVTAISVDICRKHGAWFDENELILAHKAVARRLGLRIDDAPDDNLDLDVTHTEGRLLAAALAVLVIIISKVLE